MHAWSLGSDVPGTAPASVGAASRVVTSFTNPFAVTRRQTRVKFTVQTPAGRPKTGNVSVQGTSLESEQGQVFSAPSQRRELRTACHSRCASQQPFLDTLHAALRISLERLRITRPALRVSSLDDDHSVRIDASRNQDQMFGCSCDKTASVAERRDHRDLRVCDGTDDNRRRTGLAGQQLPEAVHAGCHSRPGPDLAELAI